MSDVLELSDADFAAQMRGLVNEAERALTDREAAGRSPATEAPAALAPVNPEAPAPLEAHPPAARHPAQSPADMLKPLVQGVQAIGRTTGEHTQILKKVDQAIAGASQAQRDLPQLVTDLRAVIEQRSSVSQQMFDALHQELKTYKDGFLLDTIHRPMIRDLITLYDDLSVIHQQMQEAIANSPAAPSADGQPATLACFQKLQSIEVHVEHNLHFILEVLARLEVQQMPIGSGRLDKHTQRAVSVEMASDPEQDMLVSRTVKRGFLWKDRVVRAEEVIIKKWKEGFLVALPAETP